MEPVSPADAGSYAVDVLGYCFGVVLLAAIPYGLGILLAAGGRGGGGALLVFVAFQIAAYAIALAGIGGLLYKVVTDAVATARPPEGSVDERTT